MSDTTVSVQSLLVDGTMSDVLTYWGDEYASGPGPIAPDDTVGWQWLHRGAVGPEADRPRYVLVPHTSWGDYGGDVVGRANYIQLLDEYPETFVRVGFSTHDGMALALPRDASVPEALADALHAMALDRVLSDDQLSEVEQDIITEGWDAYGYADFRDAVALALSPESDSRTVAESVPEGEDAWTLYRDACEQAGFYAYAETATTAVLWDDRVPDAAADILVMGWLAHREVPGQLSLI